MLQFDSKKLSFQYKYQIEKFEICMNISPKEILIHYKNTEIPSKNGILKFSPPNSKVFFAGINMVQNFEVSTILFDTNGFSKDFKFDFSQIK